MAPLAPAVQSISGDTLELPNEVNTRANVSVFVVPDWIFDHVMPKNWGVDYMFDSLVLEKRLSLDELATLFFLNSPCQDQYLAKDLCLSRDAMHDFGNDVRVKADEVLSARFNTAIRESFSDRIKAQVTSDLSGIFNETSPPYGFVVSGSKIWLIVKPGFVTLLGNKELRLKFCREYLDTVNKVVSSSGFNSYQELAQTGVFAHYVKELVG